ncbi:uncharacterized protein LOC143242598 isoform X1 [Tachypleus tridentatus]|uniref:uncharacterized protein LOC143242598 isoform X1 n=1 Tax=Tachypleus tridentatus TaxID=6853 RepID=UPI003FCFEC2C
MEFLMTKLKQKLDTMSRNCSKKKTFIWTEKVKLMLLIKLLKMPRNLLRNIAVNLESIHWKYCLYFLTLRAKSHWTVFCVDRGESNLEF